MKKGCWETQMWCHRATVGQQIPLALPPPPPTYTPQSPACDTAPSGTRPTGSCPRCSTVPPPPPLRSCRLRATVSSHLRGNIPPSDGSLAPPKYYAEDARHETSHADTRAYESQDEPRTACGDACSALLGNRLGPLFLAGVFDSEEVHMLNRGHRNGLSSCRLGCHLGNRFGCTLG